MNDEWKELTEKLKAGDKRALARTITLIENETPEASKIIKEIYSETGSARVVGITGPPGSGKSTLVDKIVSEVEDENLKIGIVAVDPSSPFTGGALLGDRARMSRRRFGEGVFFRSMGTRGASGGLSRTILDVVKAMDVYGMDLILIETVGAGQNEVNIVETADTCVVVLMPKTGDEIQAMKAGILEIGDIFVVNKADLGGSEMMARQIKTMIRTRESENVESHSDFHRDVILSSDLSSLDREKGWVPPVLRTTAKQGRGVDELVEKIEEHFEYLQKSGKLEKKRRNSRRKEITNILLDMVTARILEQIEENKDLENLIEKVTVKKEMDPRTAAKKIISQINL